MRLARATMETPYIISCEEEQKDDDRDQAKKWEDSKQLIQKKDKREETEEWEKRKRERL